jgi:hypothetical protein
MLPRRNVLNKVALAWPRKRMQGVLMDDGRGLACRLWIAGHRSSAAMWRKTTGLHACTVPYGAIRRRVAFRHPPITPR